MKHKDQKVTNRTLNINPLRAADFDHQKTRHAFYVSGDLVTMVTIVTKGQVYQMELTRKQKLF